MSVSQSSLMSAVEHIMWALYYWVNDMDNCAKSSTIYSYQALRAWRKEMTSRAIYELAQAQIRW